MRDNSAVIHRLGRGIRCTIATAVPPRGWLRSRLTARCAVVVDPGMVYRNRHIGGISRDWVCVAICHTISYPHRGEGKLTWRRCQLRNRGRRCALSALQHHVGGISANHCGGATKLAGDAGVRVGDAGAVLGNTGALVGDAGAVAGDAGTVAGDAWAGAGNQGQRRGITKSWRG